MVSSAAPAVTSETLYRTPSQMRATLPGTIGELDDAISGGRNQDQINDDPDHCAAGLLRAANAPAVMLRLAAMAASRACAFLAQSATIGLARSGSAAISRKAPRNVGPIGVDLDARDHRGGIVAGRRIDRSDLHQSLHIGFELVEECRVGGRRIRGAAQGRQQRSKIVRERIGARHSAGGKGFERRHRIRGGAKRLHRFQLGLIRRAAFDGGRQHLRGDGQTHRLIDAGGRMRDLFRQRFDGALERADAA